MKLSDFQQFAQVWAGAWEQVGKTITSGAIELAFEALRDYGLPDITRALTAHIRDPQRGRFAPTVADIVAAIDHSDRSAWPGADEAWAICVRTFDDVDTVVVVDEIMQARESAQPVMDLGDEVGARMAFRETYSRLVSAARFSGRHPRWWVTSGTHSGLREQRILEAVNLGRLPRLALASLPRPTPTIGDAMRALDHIAETDARRRERAIDARGMLAMLRGVLETQGASESAMASEREKLRQAAEARRREVVRCAEERLMQEGRNGTAG